MFETILTAIVLICIALLLITRNKALKSFDVIRDNEVQVDNAERLKASSTKLRKQKNP